MFLKSISIILIVVVIGQKLDAFPAKNLPAPCKGIALIVHGEKLCPEVYEYNSKLDCCATPSSPQIQRFRRHISSGVICIQNLSPFNDQKCPNPLVYNKQENCCALMENQENFGGQVVKEAENQENVNIEDQENINVEEVIENRENQENLVVKETENINENLFEESDVMIRRLVKENDGQVVNEMENTKNQGNLVVKEKENGEVILVMEKDEDKNLKDKKINEEINVPASSNLKAPKRLVKRDTRKEEVNVKDTNSENREMEKVSKNVPVISEGQNEAKNVPANSEDQNEAKNLKVKSSVGQINKVDVMKKISKRSTREEINAKDTNAGNREMEKVNINKNGGNVPANFAKKISKRDTKEINVKDTKHPENLMDKNLKDKEENLMVKKNEDKNVMVKENSGDQNEDKNVPVISDGQNLKDNGQINKPDAVKKIFKRDTEKEEVNVKDKNSGDRQMEKASGRSKNEAVKENSNLKAPKRLVKRDTGKEEVNVKDTEHPKNLASTKDINKKDSNTNTENTPKNESKNGESQMNVEENVNKKSEN